MDVIEIVKVWLAENGYDGLCNDNNCGCGLTDFAPCDGGPYWTCEAAIARVLGPGERIGECGPGDRIFEPANLANQSGAMEEFDYINLKWGTLKSWELTSAKGKDLLRQYKELGSSFSSALQKDTVEQKKLICEMIDIVPGEIYLDWNDEYVSKEDAKKYVMDYGKATEEAI